MIDNNKFKKYGYEIVDWIYDYFENIENYPVKSQVKPGEIINQLPEQPPQKSESINHVFEDFKNIIFPGITHWQSPKFLAYFNANNSFPSILAEMMTAALGLQCMTWETSPAAAELEEMMMSWLKSMMGMPTNWAGVIQDTASTATLAAILSAREKVSEYSINKTGFNSNKVYRVYCSTETHSSIDKAVRIAGFGDNNLIKIKVDSENRMIPEELDAHIAKDLKQGFVPVCVVVTLGTTGTTAIDPLKSISDICLKHKVWLHVDAAYIGSALILPEYRWMIDGIENADSFVFNPHKWLFTNFDCSVYFVKDKDALLKTFMILPEYLKTDTYGTVNDYRDWGVPLGRRFRALKLWFVIRDFGIEGLQKTLRSHIEISKLIEKNIVESENFEVVAKRTVNSVFFRFKQNSFNEQKLNKINETILKRINKSGKAFLTHTKVNGIYTIRMVIGQTSINSSHALGVWELIKSTSEEVVGEL